MLKMRIKKNKTKKEETEFKVMLDQL